MKKPQEVKTKVLDEDGFEAVKKGKKVQQEEQPAIPMKNVFGVLEEDQLLTTVPDQLQVSKSLNNGGEAGPSHSNG